MKRKRKIRTIPVLFLGICCLAGFTLYGGDSLLHEVQEIQNSMVDESKLSYLNKELESHNALLMDVQTGEILLQKRSEDRIYPASLTKIMTVYIALKQIDNLEMKIQVPKDAIQELIESNASMAGFEPFEEVSVRDVLYGAMLPSGADACVTLAQYIGGSQEVFVEKMNETAKSLGMNQTHFTNVTGLHNEQHYSTVKDLMYLLKEAMKDETFRSIWTTQSYQTDPSNIHSEGISLTSTLLTSMTKFNIKNDYIQGAKTGYTPEAGLCMASLGYVAQHEYLFISANATGDHETQPFHIMDAIRAYQEVNLQHSK